MMLPNEFIENPMWLPVLETSRLIIRPFLLQDLADAYRILDVETAQEPRTLAERESWLRWTIAGYTEFACLLQFPYGDRAVILRETGDLVGVSVFVPCLDSFDQPAVSRILTNFRSDAAPACSASSANSGASWVQATRQSPARAASLNAPASRRHSSVWIVCGEPDPSACARALASSAMVRLQSHNKTFLSVGMLFVIFFSAARRAAGSSSAGGYYKRTKAAG